MADIWYFSDPHFDHENIIKYCDRPFANALEMNQAIVDRHNSVVKPQDHFYCLGDVAIKRSGLDWVKKLNGHGRLIGGNHDIFTAQEYLKAGFEKVMAMRVHANALFTHIPVHPASFGRFLANVHGHIHNYTGKDYPFPYINVSVEVINYTPVHLDTLLARIMRERSEAEAALCFGNDGAPAGHPTYKEGI